MAIVPNNSVYSQSNGQRKLWLIVGGLVLMTILVAVVVGVLYFTREQPDEQPVIANEPLAPTVAVTPTVGLVVEAAPTQAQQVVLVITSPTPTSTPLPTDTPVVAETENADVVERIATATRAPTFTPTSTATPRPFIPTATPTPDEVNVDGWIEPVAPDENFYLPADGLTFQWRWHENKRCQQPPDGYGFEIRVWRDVSTEFPKGAMNAKEEKVNVTCDATSGVYTFTIGNIKKVPGVSNAEFGRFKWDIAIVQLDPYTPVIASQPRIFYY